jgi:hypothetical protein
MFRQTIHMLLKINKKENRINYFCPEIALLNILVYVCSRPPEMTSALEVRCFTTAPV